MHLGIMRRRQHSITNWKLRNEQSASTAKHVETEVMESTACPCIKQEICSGVYWVTNECAQGVKEGFRPRVAFTQTCEHCPGHSTSNPGK